MASVLLTLCAFAAAAAATPLVRGLAWRLGVVDRPDGGRKKHGRPVALMGGLAIFLAIAAAAIIAVGAGWLPGDHIKDKYLAGIIIAALLLVVGGVLDDACDLPPRFQIVWPLLAALAIVASGIGVKFITNPLGGQFFLDRYAVTVLWLGGIPYKVSLIADVFTVCWLLGMTYTTKFLDGLDGLVSGVTVIGAFVIAAVSVMKEVSQPDTAMLALIVAGAFLGFLLYNASPASIFLGESGSTMAGFLLGVLAIISGGKIATTLLVVGLPLFDAAFVIVRRVLKEKKSPTSADRSHLHFRLLDLGFTPRQIVLFYCFVAALFGTSTLILKGWEKLAAIGVLASLLFALTAVGMVAYRKR
ncbi:MAG TPA: MraY family glycosyltransferase [Patescibacteria group bacterium]|nr:MraY family glycosyltransferase [Patescibacteria group bacterium]